MGGDITVVLTQDLGDVFSEHYKGDSSALVVDPLLVSVHNFLEQPNPDKLPRFLKQVLKKKDWKKADANTLCRVQQDAKEEYGFKLHKYVTQIVGPCLYDVGNSFFGEVEYDNCGGFFDLLKSALEIPTSESIKHLKQAARYRINEYAENLKARTEPGYRTTKRIIGGLAFLGGLGTIVYAFLENNPDVGASQRAAVGLTAAIIGGILYFFSPNKGECKKWEGYQQLLNSSTEVWQEGIQLSKPSSELLVKQYG